MRRAKRNPPPASARVCVCLRTCGRACVSEPNRCSVFGAVCCCDWDGGRQKTSSAIGCLCLGRGKKIKGPGDLAGLEADGFMCVSRSVCVFASRKVATQSRGELGSPALSSLCALGLSGKEFEVEDLRSPARPQPFSQISCLTAYNCATPPPPPRLPESY